MKTAPLSETRSLIYPEAHLCEKKRRCKKELNTECLQGRKKNNRGHKHTEVETYSRKNSTLM